MSGSRASQSAGQLAMPMLLTLLLLLLLLSPVDLNEWLVYKPVC
jgi:hypothetical protein